MGMLYEVDEKLVLEKRLESVVIIDNTWYNSNVEPRLFGDGESVHGVEITKEMLQSILLYFDNKENRKDFGLNE